MKIALCAGETSGDALGEGLITQLRHHFPDASFAGIGGEKMRRAGMDCWHDAHALAVMGLTEVLAHLPRLLRLRRDFRQRLLDWQPDVFIGIDAPDFNLPVERWLKQRGIKTAHYVSPSIWAWRAERAAKIGQSADTVLCLFPMEPPIYARYHTDAVFVGHPLADAIALHPSQAHARSALGLAPTIRLLAVLPGSRLSEIQRLLPTFLDAAALLLQQQPQLQLLIPAAHAECRAAILEHLARSALPPSQCHVLDGNAQTAMIASDAVLLASGTAALEAALCKRPMVIGHKIAPISYWLVQKLGLLKTAHVSLPNILAGHAIVPEFLQDNCTAENLANALRPWLQQHDSTTSHAHAALLQHYLQLHHSLRQNASARAADAIAALVQTGTH